MKQKKFSPRSLGFTLIELLVVIAIIGILTAVILTNMTASKAKARDVQRVSDVGQMQLALELYYDRCKQYPAPNNNKIDSTVLGQNTGCPSGSGVTLGSYISKIPTPPEGGNYDYVVNSASQPSDYVLHTSLEYPSSASPDSLGSSAPSYISGIFTCDTSTNYCGGPK